MSDWCCHRYEPENKPRIRDTTGPDEYHGILSTNRKRNHFQIVIYIKNSHDVFIVRCMQMIIYPLYFTLTTLFFIWRRYSWQITLYHRSNLSCVFPMRLARYGVFVMRRKWTVLLRDRTVLLKYFVTMKITFSLSSEYIIYWKWYTERTYMAVAFETLRPLY